jgi:hypothetical protein
LLEISRGSLPSTRRGFFPAYRMGMGKNSDIVGKIPPWKWDMFGKIPTLSEKFRLGQKNSTWPEKFRHGRKKRLGRVHEGIINSAM